MTTLTDIRDLETRLHSHVLEWDDHSLRDELLYLLDELENIHSDLDKSNVPTTNTNHLELTLSQRIKYLIGARRSPQAMCDCPPPLNFYGKPIEVEPKQFRLF